MAKIKTKAIHYLTVKLKKDFQATISYKNPSITYFNKHKLKKKIQADITTESPEIIFFVCGENKFNKIPKHKLESEHIFINKHNFIESYEQQKLKLQELFNNVTKETEPDSLVKQETVIGGYLKSEETNKPYERQETEKYRTEELTELEEQHNTRREINDLIGRKPGWLLHSGTTLIFFVTAVLIAFSIFLKYPDKISCTGIITSTHPPVPIFSNQSGKIDEILIADGQLITEGDPIIYLQNPLERKDLETLLGFTEKYENNRNPQNLQYLQFPKKLNLGDLQSLYSSFQLRYNEFQQTLKMVGVNKQVLTISREIKKIEQLNGYLRDEEKIYDEELALIQKNYSRQQSLLREGIVSEQDVEVIEAQLKQFQRQKESMQKTIVQNNIRIESLMLDSEKLNEQRKSDLNQYQFAISEIISNLKSSVTQWEENYYVLAEADGIVEFPNSTTENMAVNALSPLGFIIQNEEQTDEKKIIATVSPLGYGKIKAGNKVLIKVDAYPYKEYGNLVSKIEKLSQVGFNLTEDGRKYEIEIPLNTKLITDLNKELNYTPDLSAMVDIITEDKSLFNRIFEQFFSILKTHTSIDSTVPNVEPTKK